MEYYDEQIVKALHIQRRDTFGSIDEGLYINNELIHFNKTLLFNDRVSVMLPENFVPMLPEIAEVKYFSGKRPDEIYTSLDMSVNFTFTDLEITLNGKNKVGDADVAGSIDGLQGKDVERLYIEACNTGLVEYMQVEDANVASMMSKRLTGDGAVYAWNGSVSFGPPAAQQNAYKFAGKSISYEPRSSKTQSHYEEFYNEYIAAGKIKNMHVRLGQVIYYKGEFMRNGYYPGTCITNACDGSK